GDDGEDHLAAGGGHGLERALGGGVDVDDQALDLQLAVGQQLHRVVGAAHEAVGGQLGRVDLLALGEAVEVAEVDELERLLDEVEAALRQAHDQARAPAFPAGPLREAAAALLPLLAAARGLAAAAADATPDALAALLVARRGLEFVQLHCWSCPSMVTRCSTLRSMPRVLSLSTTSRTSPVFLRPRASTVARMSLRTPIRLRLRETLIIPPTPAGAWPPRRCAAA